MANKDTKVLRRFLANVSIPLSSKLNSFIHRLVADTLDAYIDKYGGLVPYLADDAVGTPSSDAPPAEQTSKAISLQVRLPHLLRPNL